MKPIAILLTLLFLIPLAPGCSKKEAAKEDDLPKDRFVSARGKKGGAESHGEPLKAGDGVITGKVEFKGEKPVMGVIKAMLIHNDAASCCLKGAESEKVEQKWMIGNDNGVANVVVFLKPPPGKYFEPNENDKNRKDKVVLDQPHCAFVPHVIATYPKYWDGKEYKPSGESFVVRNSADCKHNTNWKGDPSKNPGGNPALVPKEEIVLNLEPQNGPLQVSCDIHPWMYARIWSFDNPYFAVTNDKGEFTIKNVPTGVELSVVGWHEVADYFYGGKNGTKQQFKSGENKLSLPIAGN